MNQIECSHCKTLNNCKSFSEIFKNSTIENTKIKACDCNICTKCLFYIYKINCIYDQVHKEILDEFCLRTIINIQEKILEIKCHQCF